MSAASIAAGKAGGYARYLEGKTVAPQRGDYYLTPDGQLTEAPGRWLSGAGTLAALGIDADRPVEGRDFIALMEGRHPETGRWLRPAGADGSRGGGIDVTFSAPKSVSVVWALADPWQRQQLQAAHERAVQRAVEYLREQVPVVRRRYGGQRRRGAREGRARHGLLHTTARVYRPPRRRTRSCTHMSSSQARCVRTAVRGGRVAADLSVLAGEIGAFYRSALAQELIEQGYPVEQATGTDGRISSCRVCPGRSVWRCRAGGERSCAQPSASGQSTAVRRSGATARAGAREASAVPRSSPRVATWSASGAAPVPSRFRRRQAARLVGAAGRPVRGRAAVDRIEEKLTEREAIFQPTALRAIALEQTVGELAPEQALGVARSMVAERRVLTLEGGPMTTLQVRAQEQAIERRATELAKPADREVGDFTRELAGNEVAERIGAALSVEQETALRALTRARSASRYWSGRRAPARAS